jgi:hypothetical protein
MFMQAKVLLSFEAANLFVVFNYWHDVTQAIQIVASRCRHSL